VVAGLAERYDDHVFDLTDGEIVVLGVVVLVVLGPRNVPIMLRSVGRLVGTARKRGIDIVAVALIAIAILLIVATAQLCVRGCSRHWVQHRGLSVAPRSEVAAA